jgi:hypothetical protein
VTQMFRSCSGQNYLNPKGPGWGISLDDEMSCPWWRLEDKAGRQRKFRTFEQAERMRVRLESLFEGWEYDGQGDRHSFETAVHSKIHEEGIPK